MKSGEPIASSRTTILCACNSAHKQVVEPSLGPQRERRNEQPRRLPWRGRAHELEIWPHNTHVRPWPSLPGHPDPRRMRGNRLLIRNHARGGGLHSPQYAASEGPKHLLGSRSTECVAGRKAAKLVASAGAALTSATETPPVCSDFAAIILERFVSCPGGRNAERASEKTGLQLS